MNNKLRVIFSSLKQTADVIETETLRQLIYFRIFIECHLSQVFITAVLLLLFLLLIEKIVLFFEIYQLLLIRI